MVAILHLITNYCLEWYPFMGVVCRNWAIFRNGVLCACIAVMDKLILQYRIFLKEFLLRIIWKTIIIKNYLENNYYQKLFGRICDAGLAFQEEAAQKC